MYGRFKIIIDTASAFVAIICIFASFPALVILGGFPGRLGEERILNYLPFLAKNTELQLILISGLCGWINIWLLYLKFLV